MGSTNAIKASVLVISDTHGKDHIMPKASIDVAIHCGDLTDESKLEEYRTTLEVLKSIETPLKLVIAGNHDFSLDDTALQRQTAEATRRGIELELVKKEFVDVGQARQLFADAENEGITFLDEGIHSFRLQNGACLTVYASPYTPSLEATAGFQFKPHDDHTFSIRSPANNDNNNNNNKRVDIAITHGPPRGVLDRTASSPRSAGCPQLFAAIAYARPRLHCFGHIHESWGARLVTWRGTEPSSSIRPSHLTDIDNGASVFIDKLANYKPNKFESEQDTKERKKRMERLYKNGYRGTSHCSDDKYPLVEGKQTLFVNAALDMGGFDDEDDPDGREQVPWIVEMELPRA